LLKLKLKIGIRINYTPYVRKNVGPRLYDATIRSIVLKISLRFIRTKFRPRLTLQNTEYSVLRTRN
jgi:hypothetical protein